MHKTLVSLPAVATVAFSMIGCHAPGPVYNFEPTAPPSAARPSTCEFRVAATVPTNGDYEEVGVLDARRTPSNNLTVFKMHVRKAVCQAGGDLVVGEINGMGYYVRAVIFRKVARQPASSPAAPSGTKV